MENPQNRIITEETKKIISNCLLEKVSLLSWIQEYSNEIYRTALLTPLSNKKQPDDYRR